MLYKLFQSVPSQTLISAPNIQHFKICKGTIKQWVIFFDPEAADLLHVRVKYHGVQIMPWGSGNWIEGFFSDAPLFEDLEIDTPPYELTVEAYNEDDSYPHEYFVHPILLPDKPVKPVESGVEGLWDRMKGFLGGE